MLVAESVSLDIVRSVRAPLARLQRRDSDLARQMRRAVNSIGLNVSEGERRVGKDATHHFNIAAGSAKEVQRCLLHAEAWGYLSMADIEEPLRHLDRELGLLWGLSRR